MLDSQPFRVLDWLVILITTVSCSPTQTASRDHPKSGEHDCDVKQLSTSEERERQAKAAIGDPVAQARYAIGKRDFRLFGYSMMVPGISPAAYGVTCRPSVVSQGTEMVRSVFAASDVLGSIEQRRAERATAANHRNFGIVYNRTLLSDPRYPYRDLCRPALKTDRPDRFATVEPQDYGFRDLQVTDKPIDLGEAARRGTLDSLQSVIRDHPDEVNKLDIVGMTPLSWAIVYRREKHADMLLKAGANPAGGGCSRQLPQQAPVQIARAKSWRSMVEKMLPQLSPSQIEMMSDPPRLQKHQGRASDNAPRAVHKRYASRLPVDFQAAHSAIVKIDANGNLKSCKIEPTTGVAAMDNDICLTFRRSYQWTPARNRFGETVAGETSIRFRSSAD